MSPATNAILDIRRVMTLVMLDPCARRLLALGLVAVGLAACDRRPEPPSPAPPPTPVLQPIAAWLETENGAMVGVDAEVVALRDDLVAASIEARRTLDAARQRFDASAPNRRDRWAVKWAAPIRRGPAAGQTEQVWIVPMRWTEHRIEGVLASAPLRNIGFTLGDVVGVPVDEVADWVHMPDAPVTDGFGGRREGGFTIAVLERYAGPSP